MSDCVAWICEYSSSPITSCMLFSPLKWCVQFLQFIDLSWGKCFSHWRCTGFGLDNSLWHLLVTGRLTWHHHFTHLQYVHTSSLWLWADRQREQRCTEDVVIRRESSWGSPGEAWSVIVCTLRSSWGAGVRALVLIDQLQITGLSKCFEKTNKHNFKAENLTFL